MRKARLLAILSLFGLVWATGAGAADEHKDKKTGGKTLTATLTGSTEVPGPGDPDGSGEVTVTSEGQNRLCFDVKVSNIDPPTAAHIHKGSAGTSGPPVVTLPQVTSTTGKNCVEADSKIISEIQRSPADYYFNVHNSKYPNGAVRGQLKMGR